MKRIIGLMGILFVLIPTVVKADIGAPEIKQYEIIVTNPEGTDIYKYSYGDIKVTGKLPYNTKCEVWDETDYGDKILLSADCEGSNDYISINIKYSSDIKLISDDHEFKFYNNRKEKFHTIGEVELYTDEYLASGKNGLTIEGNKDIEVWTTTDQVWYYYEEGNIKGYFCIPNQNLIKEYGKNVIITNGTKTLKNSTGDEQAGIIIPNFTEIHSEYYVPYIHGFFYNRYKIIYNGEECYVEEDDLSYESNEKLLYEGKIPIEIYDKTISKKVTNVKLKENTIYDAKYTYYTDNHCGDSYAYVKLDGDYYWVKIESCDEDGLSRYAEVSSSKYKIKFDNDYGLAKDITIPKGTELYSYFYDSNKKEYFINYKDFSGWVNLKLEYVGIEEEKPLENYDEDYSYSNYSPNPLPKEKRFYNIKTYSIIGVVSAVIISACAIVTLIFIKRKKNNAQKAETMTVPNNSTQELNNSNVQNQNSINQEVNANISGNNQSVNVETSNNQEQNTNNNQQNGI